MFEIDTVGREGLIELDRLELELCWDREAEGLVLRVFWIVIRGKRLHSTFVEGVKEGFQRLVDL